jgi:hypothetical protein
VFLPFNLIITNHILRLLAHVHMCMLAALCLSIYACTCLWVGVCGAS